MENAEEQILSYPHLPEERRREIEAYVEDHPEWAPLLRDVRTIESIVEGRGADGTGDPYDSIIAAYVAVRFLHPDRDPPALRDEFEALERRMDEDPELRDRVAAAEERLRSAEAALDPVSHFESLTGHTLDPGGGTSGGATSSVRERNAGWPTFLEWGMDLPLAVRGAAVAAVVLVGVYGLLFGVSWTSQSTLDRLATVEVSDQVVESYYSTNTRSATATADTARVDGLYLQALSTLRGARTSTLGLFPSYDPEGLATAESQLKRVLDRTEADSFLALEAQFYLGKVYLAQGRVDAARERFRTVVDRGGRQAEEARRILRILRQESVAGSGGAGR